MGAVGGGGDSLRLSTTKVTNTLNLDLKAMLIIIDRSCGEIRSQQHSNDGTYVFVL